MAEGTLFYFDWEMRLMEWLQAHIGTSGIGFWILSNLSAFGEQLLMVVIMGFLYWGLNKEYGKHVGVCVLMANVWNPLIKNIVLRLRPYFVPGYNVKLLRLIDSSADQMDIAAQGYSFPSGHSASAVSAYGSLASYPDKRYLKNKRLLLALIAIVLPFLVGFSRVFVGAHFPTDVICGWILGIVIVLFVPMLRKNVKNRWVFYAVLLLSSLPGFLFCRSNDYFSSFGMLLGFCLAEPFEERFVKFENTQNILRCLIRTLGGGIIYFGLNEALKLPFPKELLNSGGFLDHLIRTTRYAVVIFVVIAIYPILFKYTAKLWKEKYKGPKYADIE